MQAHIPVQRAGTGGNGPSDRITVDKEAGNKRMLFMLLTVALILLILWGFGFFAHVAGGLIHLVLVAAVVVLILHFVRGR